MKYFLSICLFIICTAFSQDNIEYTHKSIHKTLKKYFDDKTYRLEELQVNENFEKYIYMGKYFTLLNSNSSLKYIYVGRVNSCRAGGCSVSTVSSPNDVFEYFDYFILFDSSCIIKQVKVYNYQATHGYEVTARGWLKQFIGYSGTRKLQVGKNIDALSGATISAIGITDDIQLKTRLLQEIIR